MNVDILNGKLPDVTREDLQTEPNCLICREPMALDRNCKKLPCGHCYHIECLEEWLCHSNECPLCHYDLTGILNQEEEEEQVKKQNNRTQLELQLTEVKEYEFFNNLDKNLEDYSDEGNNENINEGNHSENHTNDGNNLEDHLN